MFDVTITKNDMKDVNQASNENAEFFQVLNARVRVFLNPVEKHSDMPNKSYFRSVKFCVLTRARKKTKKRFKSCGKPGPYSIFF